jgi:outer membrane biogenesis lipoprotein LolB
MKQLLFAILVSLALTACSKGASSSSGNSAAPTQLNWDQGKWNETNWQ